MGEIIIANDSDWNVGAATPLETPASGAIVEPITIKHARVDIGSSVSNLLSITAEDSLINQPHDLIIDSLILTNDSHWVQGGELTVNTTYDIQNSSIDHQANFTIPEVTPYVISNGAREVLNAVHPAWTEIRVESGAHLQINVNQPQLSDLSIDSAEVEINVPQTLTNLNLTNGAILTHGQGVSGVHLTVTDVTVSADSSIDVSGKGLDYDANTMSWRSGASHGGLGGLYNSGDSTNSIYGDLRQPIDLGTSGNSNRGGGSLRLTVNNTLDLAGSIKADGVKENNNYSGGSGGSIWLEVNELSGSGEISSNGTNTYSGSGGGGRVAVYYDTLNGFNLTSQVQAFGGYIRVPPNKNHHNGGAGTIYLKDNAASLGEIIIANDTDWNVGAATPLGDAYTLVNNEPITIKNAEVHFNDIDSIAHLTAYKSQIYQNAELTLDAIHGQDFLWVQNAQLNLPSDELIVNNWSYIPNFNQAWEKLSLINGGILTQEQAQNLTDAIQLNVGQLYIDDNSHVDLNGLGLPKSVDIQGTAAGSHGGLGGVRNSDVTNAIYGSETAPSLVGVGGSGSAMYGGGAIKIVTDYLSLEGNVESDGRAYQAYNAYGSGGSIWLEVGALSGNGQIHANGGAFAPNRYGWGGGGGRVAVYYGVNQGSNLSLRTLASGGEVQETSGGQSGQDGTVYLEQTLLNTQIVDIDHKFINQAGNRIRVRFNQAVNTTDFLTSEFTITHPSDTVNVNSLELISPGVIDLLLDKDMDTEGVYQLLVQSLALDQNGNGIPGEPVDDDYSHSIVYDITAPDTPIVTNADVAPASNTVNVDHWILIGTRPADSAIMVGTQVVTDFGDSDWSAVLELPAGTSTWSIRTIDRAGNTSQAVDVTFFYASDQPAIVAMTPPDGACLAQSPAVISLSLFDYSGNGFNLAESSFELSDGTNLATGVTQIANDIFTFTPDSSLLEGGYQVSAQVQDNDGVDSAVFNAGFSLDLTAPAEVVIDPVTTPTGNSIQLISGSKEANTSVWLNGAEVVALDGQTNWQASVALSEGINNLSFTSQDCAGNESPAETVQIEFNNEVPGPVSPLITIDPNGHQALLDWQAYDELSNGGNIDFYTVYESNTAFNDVANATQIATVPAGTQQYSITNKTPPITLYYAVVATDLLGLSDPNVTSIEAEFVDVQAPEPPGRAYVDDSYADSVDIRWTHSSNTLGDLTGYKVYLDDVFLVDVAPSVNTYQVISLDRATAYTVKVTAIDQFDNESTGYEQTIVTWPNHPTNIQAEIHDSKITLVWNHATPKDVVQVYYIYSDTVDFTDVSQMTGIGHGGGSSGEPLSRDIENLNNGQTYYFTVVAKNVHGDFDPMVQTISATPVADIQPPTINQVNFNGSPLTDGMIVTHSGLIEVNATDDSGLAYVHFAGSTGHLNVTDGNGSNNYKANWSLEQEADGAVTVVITAEDVFGNQATESFDLTVDLAAPPVPSIQFPINNAVTSELTTQVLGTLQNSSLSTIELQVNGVDQASLNTDINGQFQTVVNLVNGANSLRARAVNNRGDAGNYSNPITITVDQSVPVQPIGLITKAKADGVIRINWNPDSEGTTAGYHIYRSQNLFNHYTDPGVTQINSALVTSAHYEDLAIPDGVFYYQIVGVSQTGIFGAPSEVVSEISDSLPPKADISYEAQGVYDQPSNTYGAGVVQVDITFTEPLLTTPYVSIVPDGGVPIPVTLNKQSDTLYTGYFELGVQKIDAVAYAVMSAYDKANNRGTEVTSGSSFNVDTLGPQMTDLNLSVLTPIDNSLNPSITVDFTLDDDSQGAPQLFYQLSGIGRTEVEITGLSEIANRQWQATFTLPADAGLSEAETLSFSYLAIDSLGNEAGVINLENQFQVYQGSLPPLDAPIGLTAQAHPDGLVKLTWYNVPDAAEYELWRKLDTDTQFLPISRTIGNVLEIDDTPPVDGYYDYAIASVRQENGLEAVSGISQSVSVYADSVSPEAPTGLLLQLHGNGIKAEWQASVPTHPLDDRLTYRLYRDNSPEITDVTGLTPIIEKIHGALALDSAPSETDHAYAVTAVDAAGNESLPSNSEYLNAGLLPVKNLNIDVYPDQSPNITWAHDSATIAGFDIYKTQSGNNVKLNNSLLTSAQFIDDHYAGTQTVYSVIAVDDQNQQSLPHSLRLPQLSTQVLQNQSIKRGLMNRVTFTVNSYEDVELQGVSIGLTVDGEEFRSNAITVPVQGTVDISIVIPGKPTWGDQLTSQLVTYYQPNAGESVNFHKTQPQTVEDGGLIMSITTDEFLKGTEGLIQLNIANPGEEPIDIITATQTGKNVSSDIRFRLEDLAGNVLSTSTFKQSLGTDVITMANGTTISRIAAGENFLSEPQGINIPANAPSELIVIAQLDWSYHNFGLPQQRQLQGISSRQNITLAETSYRGELTAVSPALVVGDGVITLTGRAIDRSSGATVAEVPLSISLRVDGFEQTIEVYTDINGEFAYSHEPTDTEAGIYHVSVTHPDILDRPIDGQFEVAKLYVSKPTEAVKLPFNVSRPQKAYVKAPRSLDFNQVTLAYVASDQPGSSFLPGIQINNITTVDYLNHQSDWQAIHFDMTADNSAPTAGRIVLRVLSQDTGALIPGYFSFDYQLSTAEPVFRASPQIIFTGVNQGNYVNEALTLSNEGFSDALNVNISLLDTLGNPAPNWGSLVTDHQYSRLTIGEAVDIAMSFNPPNLLADGNYEFKLRISADNANTLDVPVMVTVTGSGTGSVQFKAADVYTNTPDELGSLIPGLAGARIKLINEVVQGQEFTGTTDAFGDYLFEDIPVGWYTYRASAPRHNDLNGRIQIKPGNTESEYAFLTQDFITIEWSVTETSIIDRYEVVMNLTFETNVPAAVVVIRPVVTNLPDMYPGDVYSGVWEIKNEGLVRADDFILNIPADDEYFEYQILNEVPSVIEAQQTVYVPFKLINKKSVVPGASGDAGGGGCGGYGSSVTGSCNYQCADDTIVGAATPAFISYTAGNSCSVESGPSNDSPPHSSREGGGPWDYRCWQSNCPGIGTETQCTPDCEGDQCCDSSGQ
ncbi:hypothetical protein [Marinicella pacifica]|uniref:hypothetical protein n=1 Tax=Marinicella pacifica TaxID=1171543 RepID=UPI001E4D44FF|nr:hypothetical protein [Marinicella pacifica]